MPTGQQIEEGNQPAQVSFEISHPPVAHVLGMAYDRRHRKSRFHQHAINPLLAPVAQFDILGIAFGRVKARVGR